MGLFSRSKKTSEKEKDFLELGDDLDPSTGDYGPAGTGPPKEQPAPLDLPNPQGLALQHSLQEPISQKDLELLNSKIALLRSDVDLIKEKLRSIEAKLNIGEKPPEPQFSKPQPPQDSGWHY